MGIFERSKLDAERLEELAKEFTFFRQRSKVVGLELSRQGSKLAGLGSRQNSKLGSRQNSKLGGRQGSTLGVKQTTKLGGLGSRQATKLKVQNRDAAVTRMHLSQQQVNILANKMFYMQYNILEWQNEEKRIQTILSKDNLDKGYLQEMRVILSEVRKEKKMIAEQLAKLDEDIFSKESFIVELRKEVMGAHVATPGGDKVKHDSLVMKLHTLMDYIKQEHVVGKG